MKTYEKIETVYERDMNGTKKLIVGQYRSNVVEFLKDVTWEWTEKVDGTNIRIFWDGHTVTFAGRTERSQTPQHLLEELEKLFGGETNAQIFEQAFGEKEVILFGEGYGNKIQDAGKYYNPDGVDFILFDVFIKDGYLPRESVEGIARMFGIKAIPVVGYGSIDEAIEYVKSHPMSTLGDIYMEGIVCRPRVELKDRFGNRVIVKIKWRDFKEGAI